MLSGFELRFEKTLREAIQEQMAAYIAEMDGVDLTKHGAIVSVAKIHERHITFEEVLSMMDEIQEKIVE